MLYHRLDPNGPRLLFKGGTSLSKAYGLIQRFSEDIDITVYRDDLGENASIEDLEVLSGKRRQARLDAIPGDSVCRHVMLSEITPADSFGNLVGLDLVWLWQHGQNE